LPALMLSGRLARTHRLSGKGENISIDAVHRGCRLLRPYPRHRGAHRPALEYLSVVITRPNV